jgi:hypothetical protein
LIADFVGWIEAINWGAVGDAISDAFSTAWEAVKNFFVGIGRFFHDLPGNILAFIKSLPQRFVAIIKQMFSLAIEAVGFGIGLLLALILKSPGMVLDALKVLLPLLGEFFTFVWNDVKNRTVAGWNNFINFIETIPSRVVNALGALVGAIGGVFTRARESGESIFRTMVNNIVGFFSGLGPRLIGFAVNLGVDIFNGFKRLLNGAINSINAGIARVDAFIPGDLPRLPLLARGGITSSPAIIGEAGTEAAIPLNDSRAMSTLIEAFNRATQSGANVGLTNNMTVIVEIDGQQLEGRIVSVMNGRDRVLRQRVNSRRA